MATENNLSGYHIYRPEAWILASDEDASEFLQSQFSNDLSNLEVGDVKYGLWLDQRGKVHGDSFAFRAGKEDYFLMSYGTSQDTILNKLNRYIVADDVQLEGLAEKYRGVLLLGDGLKFVETLDLSESGTAILTVENETVYCFPGYRGQAASIELICRAGALPALVSLIADRCPGINELSGENIERLRIYSGYPKIPIDIGPTELPQEGGLENNAVSFNKGCFLGQEVMSRLQSMGQVRRSLKIVSSEKTLDFGAPVYLGNKKVGVVKSSFVENGKTVGLAIISNNVSDESNFNVGEPESGNFLKIIHS